MAPSSAIQAHCSQESATQDQASESFSFCRAIQHPECCHHEKQDTSISEDWVRLWQTHKLTSSALVMRKPVSFPVSKTYSSVFISHNPAFLGGIATRERHFANPGLWRITCVLKSPPSQTYMVSSLFSSQWICQNCFFSATHIKVQSSGARELHSCISLLLHFPVLESRAWISLIPAIVCIGGTRSNMLLPCSI